jgi:hypothetical protein
MPRKAAAKKTTFGSDLIERMKVVLAQARQNRTGAGLAEADRREDYSKARKVGTR